MTSHQGEAGLLPAAPRSRWASPKSGSGPVPSPLRSGLEAGHKPLFGPQHHNLLLRISGKSLCLSGPHVRREMGTAPAASEAA